MLARFPRYGRLFHGKQGAHNLPDEFTKIVLAGHGARALALGIGLAGLFLILVLHVLITWFSPPVDPEYEHRVATNFDDYRLAVGGPVEKPTTLSLAELRELGETTQTVEHSCIQGWTAVAQWGGVPVATLLEHVRPTAEARHIVFYAMDGKGLTEAEGRYGYFYGSVPLFPGHNRQTILALEMNGEPLPVSHGAPVRLRIETQLGFKMVKWVVGIELVDDITSVGMGMGGWREDQQYYANAAGI